MVADIREIHEFVIKWSNKFRDPKINYTELVDRFMADDCVTLGFEMDCGRAFSEKYGQAANNYEALEKSLMMSQIFHCLVQPFVLNGVILTIGHL